jgi:hypothetical protein
MRSRMSFAIVAVLLGLTWSGAVSAQSFGVYIGPSPAYDYDDSYAYGYVPPRAYGPRVYGYTRRYEDRGYVVTRPAGRCGTYRYWNGDRCVDARND